MTTRTLRIGRIARLFLAIAFLLTAAASPQRPTAAQPPTITLIVSPSSGPPGSAVTLTGAGYTPGGYQGTIRWDGVDRRNFMIPIGGAFSIGFTIPADASPGDHTITVCAECGGGEFEQTASAAFRVVAAATATPTRRPPTATPTFVPMEWEMPTACDPTGRAGEIVIDFEDFPVGADLRGVRLPQGIRLLGDDFLTVVDPTVETRSESRALLNDSRGREFGSINIPIRISFENLVDFVGVFVGLPEWVWLDRPFVATLTAYGLDDSGRRVVVARDEETLLADRDRHGALIPVPIETCLSVSAPGRIFEVTIDYNTAPGEGGVAEGEVIDNLIIRGPMVPVPVPADDLPPVVTITNPPGHALITDTFVRLDGTIVEDRELARVELWLNGALYTELGFSHLAETQYGFFLNAIPASDLVNCSGNLIEVRAWDAAGNRGASHVNFVVRAGDLEVVSAEPVQVVYGAPLIVGKGTAFRVRVNSTYPCEVEAEFRLTLPPDQWDTGAPPVPGFPSFPGWSMPDISGPATIPANAREHVVMLPYVQDRNTESAFHPTENPFGKLGVVRVVPRPSARDVSFSVEVDPRRVFGETDEGNNAFRSGPYRTETTRGVRIVFIGQVWDHDQFVEHARPGVTPGRINTLADENAFLDLLPDYAAQQMDYLLGTYPVADTKVTWRVFNTMYYRADYQADYERNTRDCWDAALEKEKGCNPCFLNLMSAMIQADEATSDAHAVAMVQPFGCCGCDWDGIAFYVEENGAPDGNVVHELGHQDIGARDCYLCTYADGSPGCKDHGDLTCESCAASEGFWVNQWQPYDESAMYYMWCVADPATIWARLERCETHEGVESSAAYRQLINRLRDAADPAAVVVRGSMTAQGTAAFSPFLRVEQAIVDLQPGAPGTHAVVFLDAAGQVLASHGFTPVFTRYMPEPEGAVPVDTYYFSFRVAWVDGIAAIELREAAGGVLASRTVSAHGPRVQLLAPNGGERWTRGSRQEVRWSGEDPDGDALSYALWISNDDGQLWMPLAIDIAGTSYRVDTDGLPVGDAYRIKVRVTDGVNTGQDVSDAVFSVQAAAEIPIPLWVVLAAGALVVMGLGLITIGLLRRRPRAAPKA